MAAGVAIAGAAIGTVGAISAGNAAEKQARQNQQLYNKTAYENELIAIENKAIADKEADAVLETGLYNVQAKRKEIARLLSYQRVQEAISGFKYEGTPIWTAEASQFEGEQDVSTIWANALIEANMMREKGRINAEIGTNAASNMRIQGDIVASAGRNAQQAGYYSGASTLLSGVGNAYMGSQYPGTTTTRYRT